MLDDLMTKKGNSIDAKTKEIANFSFPFINRHWHDGMLDELIEATESMISDAQDYLKYLKHLS